MKNHTLVTNNLKYISDSVYEKIKNYTIGKDDLYLTIAGTIGSVGIVPEMFNGMNLTENAVKLTNILIDKMFLVYGISSQFVQSQFSEKTKQMAQPKLAIERILTTLIPLPPINEQISIVSRIEEIMPIADKYEKSQEALDKLNSDIFDKLKKSVLQEAIQGKLVSQDPNDEPASVLLERIKAEKAKLFKKGKLKKKDITDSVIFKGEDNKYYEQIDNGIIELEQDYLFPDTWSILKLRDICLLTDGVKREGKGICMDAKFLRGKSVGEHLDKGKFVYKGDDIILVDGENSGEVFSAPIDGYMGSTFKQLWVSSKMHKPYVLLFILFYKDKLRNSKKGAAIPHLNKEIFYNLVIGIPPLEEQKRIVNQSNKLFQLIK